MRTTKKILASVLAVCVLASSSILTGFAATADDTVGGNTDYSKACETIDKEYTYTGGDLGATYTPAGTTFKVWSPTATKVVLNRYATGSDMETGAKNLGTVELEKVMDGDKFTGVWTATVAGDIVNTYYTYTVTAAHPKSGELQTKEIQDVYSVATGVNGKRSMVCDLDKTDPAGWENDKHILFDESTESYVWELHVKDFSHDPNSGVSEPNRGKYTAFTEKDTTLNGEGNVSTCVDYLKQLGVTTVQLNPFYDFQSIDETGDDDQFNWGYDPQNYNVPEGSYSTNPYDGNVRITECKQMIQALHNAGIAVVMDVVYNHTFNTDSCFQGTVPDYYYRLNKDGTFSNGSGCGNEVSSERAMTRDYIIQSCRYWVDEYHVDGFRFDLMGLLDVETMNLIRANLDEVSKKITIWGEGWTGGTSNYPTKTCTGAAFKQATQANAKLLDSRVAFFNDKIRDGIKGSVFDTSDRGFIAGTDKYAPNIRHGIRANSNALNGWLAKAPEQCVTYADCHDNATLYDQIVISADLGKLGERHETGVAMNKLAAAIEFTSQGILFNLAGQEMARTKFGDTNSYRSSPEINKINWQNIVDYADLVSYYKGLRTIRENFKPFTTADKSYDKAYHFNSASNMGNMTNVVAFTVDNNTAGQWKKMAVLFNGYHKATNLKLDDTSCKDWIVIANEKTAGVTKLAEVKGSTFTVEPNSAVIAVDKESFESTPIESGMGTVVANYVYYDGTPLTDPMEIQGNIDSGYQVSSVGSVPNTYVLSKVEGSATGVFTKEPQSVTFVFKDYVPESLDKYGDLNGDGKVDISDVTCYQQYLAELITLPEDVVKNIDFNYDGAKSIADATMEQMFISELPVSTGKVVINYFYTDDQGEQKTFTDPIVIEGRVGDPFTSKEFKVMGYIIDESRRPKVTEGAIPFGNTLNVDYYYELGNPNVKLHIKHNGTETWAPHLWIWGSDLNGNDSGNYSPDDNAKWPGIKISDTDGDGWFDYSFTYTGTGTYNVILSKNGSPQTKDYKGYVSNEMWIVINDSRVYSSNDFATLYSENPDENPNAPIAPHIY